MVNLPTYIYIWWHSGKLWEKQIIFFFILLYYYLKITGSFNIFFLNVEVFSNFEKKNYTKTCSFGIINRIYTDGSGNISIYITLTSGWYIYTDIALPNSVYGVECQIMLNDIRMILSFNIGFMNIHVHVLFYLMYINIYIYIIYN